MRSNQDDVAYINGEVLAWARKRSGLTLEQIGDAVRSSSRQVQAWESGDAPPPFSKAQDLAKLLRIPFGYFYLPGPPEGELPLPDFRTVQKGYRPTPDFLELLNSVILKRDWYMEHLVDAGEKPLPFPGSVSVADPVVDVADLIRKRLEIGQSFRQTVRNTSEYMSALSRAAERAGILVMRSSVVGNSTNRKVGAGEVKGFAISDKIAPLVFVNADDFKASQIFTLAHEWAHVWVGSSGISNPDQTEVGRDSIESFCNRVAAETLVPNAEFLGLWDERENESALVAKLAKWFLVSTLVIVRRAHETGRITTAKFNQLREAEMKKQAKPTGGGGDYYRSAVTRMGANLTYAVLGEVKGNRILLRDASRLLDMRVPTVLKFADIAERAG